MVLMGTERNADLADVMDLCEHNYLQLQRLVPSIEAMGRGAVSHASGSMSLYLRVLEQCRYTHTIVLTYRFRDGAGTVVAPNLRVRVYHDLRIAEALDGVTDAGGSRNLPLKWRRNMFLHKWLHYCLALGHCFIPSHDSGAHADISATVLAGAEPASF